MWSTPKLPLATAPLSRGATVCVGLLQQGESGVDGLLAGKQHAAVTETSLMLHYAPELVHMDRMVEEAGATAKSYVRYPVRQGDVPAHGGLANPAGSSAERGRLIAEACVDAVAEICAEEFGE